MNIIAAGNLALALLAGIQKAIAEGRQTLTDADVDFALVEMDASDQRLTDAIARARAREADGSDR